MTDKSKEIVKLYKQLHEAGRKGTPDQVKAILKKIERLEKSK